MNDQIKALNNFLLAAEKIMLFTGAGISTNSGIPDYRGPQGVWKTRQPVYFDDFMSSYAARVEYWDFKLESWENYKHVQPNSIHRAIAKIEKAGKMLLLVTQNVDGLHVLAGNSREKLVEIHGTDRLVECMQCHEFTDPDAHFELFKKTQEPPACHSCGGILKPATISFGQSLRQDDLQRAYDAASECDCVLALGSTLSVHPAASLPLAAARRGIPYIIINRGNTDHDGLSYVSLRIDGDVADYLPAAVEMGI
ncbi:Sir2 family NAD-dependent protein deacetylase [candidate division KSB1 bacterium]|nr:Sir2 family NAD-dependent protein deacetylase [candidate division KSB1 bacterium]